MKLRRMAASFEILFFEIPFWQDLGNLRSFEVISTHYVK